MVQEKESTDVAGCLVVPMVAAVVLLGAGIWMMTRWGDSMV